MAAEALKAADLLLPVFVVALLVRGLGVLVAEGAA